MKDIIQQFIEKVINLKERSFKDLNNINFLSDFTDNLNMNLMELGRELVLEYINELETLIYNSKERKEKFTSYQKDSLANQRKVITIFGEIEYSRRYYQDKNDKQNKVYLLDKAIGLSDNERMLVNVEENMLELATIKSYEFAGKKAAYDTVISKETVKNKIANLDFSNVLNDENKDKKQVSELYIQADEDHVSLQDGNTAMPRLITIYEENINGKLIGKKKFGGIYLNNIDSLWEEVCTYIDNTYVYEKISNIYIMGDGASWIKTGLEWLPKSIYVSDRFHIEKAVIGLCGKDNTEYITKIRTAMFEFDFIKVKELSYEILAEEMDKSVRKRKEALLKYLLNNEKGFKNSIKYDVPGCAAEGDISHTYSDRMSSRPLGWSEHNVDKMARLRVLRANGTNIRVVTRNENNTSKEKIEEQQKVIKMINNVKRKQEAMIACSIPELQYGDYETKMKIREILAYKAI